MKRLRALHHLVDAYLHEDFADLYGSAWGAVEQYARAEPEYARQLSRDIAYLLDACTSESELESALDDLGICYLPTGDGWTDHRTWLLAVANRVDSIVRTSPAA
ncbi:contact-dependent growth inhibition system immunity protein [Jatrophihabitans sp.]|uniref:contact-dependent growth inhibition system immunity protein n=1 Tax=Jatrophihabitans sp. TaxID=1932789 RepID=UPI002CE9441A|nr:contact-dependent growth inhibition system immunity protein [Jatrophihabitans sp.]